jgi:hypothetical protein
MVDKSEVIDVDDPERKWGVALGRGGRLGHSVFEGPTVRQVRQSIEPRSFQRAAVASHQRSAPQQIKEHRADREANQGENDQHGLYVLKQSDE